MEIKLSLNTRTKRQATHQGCLPGFGGKGIEIVSGENTNILYWAD
jgi:hypothetical protein